MRPSWNWPGASIASAVATLALAGTASAVLEPIDGVVLQSGGGAASWDAFPDVLACVEVDSYSPVDDGSFTSGLVTQSNAFNGGLVLHVFSASTGYRGFLDGDGQGDHVGRSLTVGPRTVLDLRITRTDRGLKGSPTLRSLVKLTNTTDHKLTRVVSFCSFLGSDEDTGVRASSSADHKFTVADRWVVTSDSATTPARPPVTHVFSGKGTLRVTKTVFCAPGPQDSGCVGQQLKFTLGAGKTRYLLFYAEMHDTNENAILATPKYNNKHLTAALLAGISQTVKSRILNWDLG